MSVNLANILANLAKVMKKPYKIHKNIVYHVRAICYYNKISVGFHAQLDIINRSYKMDRLNVKNVLQSVQNVLNSHQIAHLAIHRNQVYLNNSR
jgi:hypothetical protein